MNEMIEAAKSNERPRAYARGGLEPTFRTSKEFKEYHEPTGYLDVRVSGDGQILMPGDPPKDNAVYEHMILFGDGAKIDSGGVMVGVPRLDHDRHRAVINFWRLKEQHCKKAFQKLREEIEQWAQHSPKALHVITPEETQDKLNQLEQAKREWDAAYKGRDRAIAASKGLSLEVYYANQNAAKLEEAERQQSEAKIQAEAHKAVNTFLKEMTEISAH